MDGLLFVNTVLEQYLLNIRTQINESCNDKEPWQIIAYTFASTCLAGLVYRLISSNCISALLNKEFFFRRLRRLPWIKRKIDSQLVEARKAFEKDIHKTDVDMSFLTTLPESGYSEDVIISLATEYSSLRSYDFDKGMASGAVYADDSSLSSVNTKVFSLFCWSNPLHPDLFPGCRKMEAEIVRMVCTLFHGDKATCGTVTTGGTESILLACLAYKSLALEKGIETPEIVAPVTAHAAFDKAAHLFGMKIVHVPLDHALKVDIKSMKRAINPRTCMLVGSCPNFPHGIVDPIEDIAKIGRQNDIPVHVDACLGGFLICFMENCGFDLKPFDFRVPGVTSISADTHKYGFAPKGTSVIMYENEFYRKYQYFCQPNWPGGIYASPTLSGSRCGANIAVCWSTLLSMGKLGYVEKTRKIIEKTRFIIDKLHKISGIRVLGEPEVSVVAFTSDIFNIYHLCDEMSSSGWNLNALQYPAAIHLCVTAKHLKSGVAEKFVDDVRRISAELMKTPARTSGGIAAIYGTSQNLPDRSLVADMAAEFLNACYSLPRRTDVD